MKEEGSVIIRYPIPDGETALNMSLEGFRNLPQISIGDGYMGFVIKSNPQVWKFKLSFELVSQ